MAAPARLHGAGRWVSASEHERILSTSSFGQQHRIETGFSSATAGNWSGADTDGAMVALWLTNKRSALTQRAYAADAKAFALALAARGKTLRTATALDVQAWKSALKGADASRARRVSAIKSLLSFAHKSGYLPFNVGTIIDVPRKTDGRTERILDEDEVRAIRAAASGKHAAMVDLLYLSGMRVSEICMLQNKRVRRTGQTFTITVHGKGSKTRYVLVRSEVGEQLGVDDKKPEAFVFATRTGRRVHPTWVWKMIRKAAAAAGVDKPVSPHWMRHAYASHALDHGAPVPLVQQSLGHASLATTGIYAHARPTDSAGLYLDKRPITRR